MTQSQPEPKKINDLQKPSVEDVKKEAEKNEIHTTQPEPPKRRSGPRLSETW